MKTHWLHDKVGGITRTLEMTTPGFFKMEPSSPHVPEYFAEIFGRSDSEEERMETAAAVQLNVSHLEMTTTSPTAPPYELTVGNQRENASRNLPSSFSTRCRVS